MALTVLISQKIPSNPLAQTQRAEPFSSTKQEPPFLHISCPWGEQRPRKIKL